MTITVTKNALSPPVVDAGPRGTFGNVRLEFDFSSDWDGMTKYIVFYTARGQAIEVPYLSGEIDIPPEVMALGGTTRYNVVGVEIVDGQTVEQLKVSGQILVTFNPGENPRLAGRITPSTLELFLSQAEAYIVTELQNAKDSGEFDGADGADGQNGADGTPAGFGTPIASAVSLSQDSDPTVTVTASGDDTAKVFTFVFGIPKSVGKNFTILGHYNSLSALQAAVPTPEVGDAYSVGSSTPYNVYVYDGVTHAWANYGAISAGSVTVDSAMSDSSANAVENRVIKAYVDAVEAEIPTALKNPNALTIFGSSYDGSSAVTVTMDSEMSDSSANAVQNQVIKAYVDGLISTATGTLSSSGWTPTTGGYTQTVSVTGVTSGNTIMVSAAPASIKEYGECGVYASAQGSGTITFFAETQPSNNLTVNVVIWRT